MRIGTTFSRYTDFSRFGLSASDLSTRTMPVEEVSSGAAGAAGTAGAAAAEALAAGSRGLGV